MRQVLLIALMLNSAAFAQTHNARAREQWFHQGRILHGETAASLRRRVLTQKKLGRAQNPQPNSPNPLVTGAWVQLGPAPIVSDASGTGLQDYSFVAGPATAVAIDPADPGGNTVYLGTAYGGLWKSTNAGPLSANPASVVWSQLTDDQDTLAIGSVAIQPQSTNPNPANSVILVGTGETNGSAESYYGLGILRSPDAGNHWALITHDNSSPVRNFAGLGFSKIAFSTSAPSLVVAGAAAAAEGIIEGRENPPLTNRGIYVSNNGGIAWNYAIVKDGSIVISPSSVSSVAYNSGAGKFFAAISLHGIYSSSDGANWSRLVSQPGSALTSASCPANTAPQSNCPLYRGELAVVPNRNEMYLWFVDANDNDGGIWGSKDGGASWFPINENGITSCGDFFGGCGTADGTYNLSLAAVPDGSATDLYAGAGNLYKCTLSFNSPDCSSAPFINLTHVYGCSGIAKVNPAQHSIASMLINGDTEDVMYFANDGGIYRALDGYSGLTTGGCTGTNRFDSLNETLGSVAQLISFSQSSTMSPSPNILLAGAQANGSPGTIASQSVTGWQNVNAGEGGYTAISPANDDLWFVSNPPDTVSGVNILSCAFGAACHTLDFQNHQVATGPDVGNDSGAFNTPFILDPQNPGLMLVGTCRMWRGPSSGGPFTKLSDSFETGGTGICNGDEDNLVRAIAAAGLANGASKVIYAGTSGTGPSSQASPAGGRVWINTNIALGPAAWNDQTGPINPDHFPISAIAVDTSDSSGLTAYVGIMGFHVAHVWKTSDGGNSWADFTGALLTALPDAPVNTLLVDAGLTPDASTIYAGTDLGVFASKTNSPGWSEVGPAANSGTPGFLPNVAVTALQIFDTQHSRRLRASTYGRGMWELAQFTMSRPVPDAVTVGAPATSEVVTFQLTSAGLDENVSLDCEGLPGGATCNFLTGNPVHVGSTGPTIVNLSITTSANTLSGVSSVAIHAGPPGGPTITQNLILTVTGGFEFSFVNSSGPQTVTAGQSATYNLLVTPALGSFPTSVFFKCSGLPALTTCAFNPAQIDMGGGSTGVTLTIGTSTGTPSGSYPVTLTATSGQSIQNATATLIVQNGSAFSFSLSSSGPPTVAAGLSARYEIKVTPSSGVFPNPVNLVFSGCPPLSACSFNTAQVPSGSGPGDVFLTIAAGAGTPPGVYTVTVTGTSGTLTASTTISLTVQATTFNFSLSSSGPATITAGSSAKYDITATPSTGTFPNPVSFVLSGCPAVSTCSFSTTQIAAGSATTDVFLTVVTTPPAVQRTALFFALTFPFAGLLIAGAIRNRQLSAMLMLTMGMALATSCGGLKGGSAAPAGNPGTPVGVYTITVTGTCGAVQANTTISITVKTAQ